MRRWVETVLSRYGQEVSLERKTGTEHVRAFLQPVTERDEAVPEIAETGWLDGRLWLCLGLTALEAGDRIVWNGERFRVRSARPHYIGDTLCHWRAVLERARETE